MNRSNDPKCCPHCSRVEGLRASQCWTATAEDGLTPIHVLEEWQCTEGCFKSFWLPTSDV
jgi:hypothetical protein